MFLLIPVHADSDVLLTQGAYEIHATVLLPHLREALANTKTIETRCLKQQSATEVFPILKHPSFTDCLLKKGLLKKGSLERDSLEKEILKEGFIKESELNNDSALYHLQCQNADAATGQAYFTIEDNQFSARLEIKMGAKNMTMTQYVQAKKIGECLSQ